MAKVNFEDKVAVREIDLPAKNVIKADDVNELKKSINDLYDESINITGAPSKGDRVQWDGTQWIPSPQAALKEGTLISFSNTFVYGDFYSGETGNITNNLDDARIGIVQKLYHEAGSTPTVPVGWVLIGSGTYDTAKLNIIYAEWIEGSRVEYWIVQEA